MSKDRFGITVGGKIPDGFKPAECCQTCGKCFTEYPIDDPVFYYCLADGTKPPQPPEPKNLKERMSSRYRKKADRYDDWKMSHSTFAGGYCNLYKSKKDIKIFRMTICDKGWAICMSASEEKIDGKKKKTRNKEKGAAG